MNLLEATSIFQRLISVVNNGHTEIDFPGQSYGEYAYAGGIVFPLELAFEDDKSLVRKNFSNNDLIKIGSEILSINGVAIRKDVYFLEIVFFLEMLFETIFVSISLSTSM